MAIVCYKKKARIAVLVGLLLIGMLFVLIPKVRHRYAVKEAEELLKKPLPEVLLPAESLQDHDTRTSEPQNLPSVSIRASRTADDSLGINLPVTFTSQAPHGNWAMPYQEACEEASVLMAIRYVFNNPILSPEDADSALKDLLRTNESILGFPVDQTAQQVAMLIHAIDPKIPVAIVDNPSVEMLKDQLNEGNVIIVPSAGRKLKNPFYRQPGPLYHMLVLRGYTYDGYFITNDPGTKRGENYLYSYDRIMEAMGDWNDGRPEDGKKVVLVIQSLPGFH